MKPFILHKGLVVPLDRENVDTDLIIPKQFLKSVKRTGFGEHLFDELRYLNQGYIGINNQSRPLNTEFVLNKPKYKNSSILLARKNFGCGSSREHALWALVQYGFRAIIAPSFADIFLSNSFKNGLLPIVLPENELNLLFEKAKSDIQCQLEIDLSMQTITILDEKKINFEIDSFWKHSLMNGLDDIDLTLQYANEITSFELQHLKRCPWIENNLHSVKIL